MKIRLRHSLLAVFITVSSVWSSTALAGSPDAQDESKHWFHRATGLIEEVRDATRRFQDVSMATAEGYGAFLGCVSGPQEGAMGIHFVNGGLVEDGVLNAEQPEVLIYEPRNSGRLQFVAVEYLVIAADWDAVNPTPPSLVGQAFHYSFSPNRYGLPPFYSLHAWAWKRNPHGAFVDWNPKVSCEEYAPEAP